jgi:hypothetical protein
MLINAYYSLLVDVQKLTGIHLDLPDDLTMSWVLLSAPALDKQLLVYLENGGQPPEFPEWLKPLWDHVLTLTGEDYDAYSIEQLQGSIPLVKTDGIALKCLRTLLVFGYKAEFEPSNEQLQTAQNAFEDANQGVGIWNTAFKQSSCPSPMFREARRLVGRVISRIDWTDIIPSHGPGAVYPPRIPCEKGDFGIYHSINECYPYDVHFNGVHNVGFNDLNKESSEVEEIQCRMIAVPKDSRGPRLICVHPAEAVWIQQGQRHVLEAAIESCPLTSGKINFTDQSVNGSLALSSSLTQEYVTLDLKEASDRVGTELVNYLFGSHASKYLNSTRARRVRLIDDRLVELQMFAPMGNALTFPVESLVFWAVARAGILSRYGVSCSDVYVFGDDIILPTKYYEGALNGLIRAGLIPNIGKTFRKGFFRESCGVDAYHGKDVTPLRCKVRGINSYSDAESACDLAKRLRMAGFDDTSAFLYSSVSRRFGRLVLTNNPFCQGLVEYTNYDLGTLLRYEPLVSFNKKLHVWQVPVRRRVRTSEVITAHAWWHVQDSLLALIRKSLGMSPAHWSSQLFKSWKDQDMGAFSSERGLKYPTPRGERLQRGMENLISM